MRAAVCLVLLTVVSMALSQHRSPYASRPVGTLQVLSRFNGDDDNLPNRIGEENSTRDQGPLELPSGVMGDPYLNPRLPEWPTQHQPFWYLNQQQIMNHRGQARGGQTTTQQPGGQPGAQQVGQQVSQPGRQQGGQVGRPQFGQSGRPQFGQPGRQQGGQPGRQQGGQQGTQQGSQEWNG